MSALSELLEQTPRSLKETSPVALMRVLDAAREDYERLKKEAEMPKIAQTPPRTKYDTKEVSDLVSEIESLRQTIRGIMEKVAQVDATVKLVWPAPEQKPQTFDELIDLVADLMGVTSEALRSSRRTTPLARARAVYGILALAAFPDAKLRTVAESIDRDHSTLSVMFKRLVNDESFIRTLTRVAQIALIPGGALETIIERYKEEDYDEVI